MTDNIPSLIADAAWWTDGYTEESASGETKVIIRLAAALRDVEAERDRYRAEAESARKTGERILADALRYRAALIDAKQMVTIGMNADRVIERLARALNEGDPDE